VVVARLFNTVGPRQTGRYGMVLPTFVLQALMGKPITVFGDGRQSRCFSYVGEVVKALAALADCPAALGQVVNVGGREEITIGDLAELVKSITGSTSPIVTVPYDQAYEEGFEDMARRLPDVGKLQRLVGFAPAMDIRAIVESVVAHYRES
jgi:UDP-glucose 4-epimerase